jgi:hypothetical protein
MWHWDNLNCPCAYSIGLWTNYGDKIHEWTIWDFALEARRIGANGGPWASTVTSEHILDAAIKLVAAVIEKYFTCDLQSLSYPWTVPKTCVCKGSQTVPTNVMWWYRMVSF